MIVGVRSTGIARNAPNGVLGLDTSGLAPLSTLPIRTAQVTRAARPVLVAAGGTVSGFITTLGGADATDGSWEAALVEAYAPIGGLLYVNLSTYLQSLGLTAAQAVAQLAAIWTAAAALTP